MRKDFVSLRDSDPEAFSWLEREYSPNNTKPLENYSKGARYYPLWICPDCLSEYPSKIYNRITRNIGCPFCCGQRVNKTNCLSTTHPNLMSLWDFDKNIITPEMVTYGSHRKVWWKCSKNHNYLMKICHKTIYNCECSKCQTYKNERLVGSILEQNGIYFEPQKLIKLISNLEEMKNMRVDYYLPQSNIIIEYNGIQHYQPTCFQGITKELAETNFNKQKERDVYLQYFCKKNNIRLLIIDGRKYKDQKLEIYLLEIISIVK